jgi:hypothetical protein
MVLVDYLTVLGQNTRPGPSTPFEPSEIAAFRRISDRLASAFAAAAERNNADLVRASALSAGHALGSSEPWVTGFRPAMRPVPFHPSPAGMAAGANAIHRLLTA